MITDVISVPPDTEVEDAMALLKKHNIRALPVLDQNKKFLGMFGSRYVLAGLLPVSVRMDDGLQGLDFVVGAAPGIGKRLRKLKPQKVETVMDRNIVVTYPDTPLLEVIRLLVQYGSPLPVVDEDTGIFIGIVTEQSAIVELEKPDDELEKHMKAGLKKKKDKTKTK